MLIRVPAFLVAATEAAIYAQALVTEASIATDAAGRGFTQLAVTVLAAILLVVALPALLMSFSREGAKVSLAFSLIGALPIAYHVWG